MPRVVGVDIPAKKRLLISLTYIFGLGRHLSAKIIDQAGLDPNMKAEKLTEAEISKLTSLIQSDYTVEGDLKRQIKGNIQRLVSMNAYRGIRHRTGLPVRGQRTKSNARTRKGRKKTVANKKK